MIAKPARFICLAAYMCRCRPVGKPVSESTMKRHRDAANRLRFAQGLSPLPRGPLYSHARASIEYDIFMHSGLSWGGSRLPVSNNSGPNLLPDASSWTTTRDSSVRLPTTDLSRSDHDNDFDGRTTPNCDDVTPWRLVDTRTTDTQLEQNSQYQQPAPNESNKVHRTSAP